MSRALVPCYHAISESWAADLSVTPATFQAQLEHLLRRGYRGVTVADAIAGSGAGRVMAISFDDAFLSVYDLAFPIMRRLGVPGTMFVPTDWPDRDEPMTWPGIDQWLGGRHERELRCMTWDQLRELRDAGWEIGSHTQSHPHLTDVDDERLATELRRSKEVCEEQMGGPCRSIAYPYGSVDDRVAAAAGAAGYTYGATLKASIPSPEPLRWPRVGLYHGDRPWRWRLKLSALVNGMRESRVGDAVDRVRGV